VSFLKGILSLIPLLFKLAGEFIKSKEYFVRRRRHEKIDEAFEKDDPREAAADLNKFFD
jgi:hypothetical protein